MRGGFLAQGCKIRNFTGMFLTWKLLKKLYFCSFKNQSYYMCERRTG
jgi:hypothetical protein